MMFGTAASLYAAPGITSAASRAAQSGPTQFVTSDAAGNLATANFSPQDITSLGASVATLQQDLQRGLAQAFEGCDRDRARRQRAARGQAVCDLDQLG